MPPTLKYIHRREFDRDLRRLQRQGGPSRLAADQATEAVALWKHGHEVTLKRTKKGESRVQHVVKYDLTGFHRLVVWENDGLRIPLTVGHHEEVDHWLEQHRGWEFSSHDNAVEFAPGTDRLSTAELTEISPFGSGPIFDRIPEDILSRLNLQSTTLAALRTEITFENVDEEATGRLLNAFAYTSEEVKTAVLNAICLIAQGQDQIAMTCLHKAIGSAVAAKANPDGFRSAILSGANSDRMATLGGLSEEEIKQLLSLDHFADWMLFLHPDQTTLVEAEFSGPARLLGISGSGKTCVLVHRARHLARKYAGQRILIVTLSRALVHLIEYLLDSLCAPDLRKQIDVLSTYDYCYTMVKIIEPKRLIEQSDPLSGEDLVACWKDFLEKPHAMASYQQIADILDCRKDRVDPSSYILDELIWIRSGFGYDNRKDYLSCQRATRGIGFPTYDVANPPSPGTMVAGIPSDVRQRILNLLNDYEEYMAAGGLLDQDGVSLAAYALKHRIREFGSLQARCVLVDEVQDFSTVELAVLKEIPTAEIDGVFLCGDSTQKVFPKQQSMTLAGLDLQGRGNLLKRNYRNTRQILQAAFKIIERYRKDAGVDESEILEPEYAFREGYKPDLYECSSREQQVEVVMSYLKPMQASDHNAVCVCSASDITLAMFEEQANKIGYTTVRLTGLSHYAHDGIRVSRLDCVKGHEFSRVFLMDLSDSELPRKGLPHEEYWRDAFQTYVAMTRARDVLVMTYTSNRSILLRDLWDTIDEAHADDMPQSTQADEDEDS